MLRKSREKKIMILNFRCHNVNNHSSIWKNITMIIFFILLLFLILILLIRFQIKIYLKIDGMKSYFEIKFICLKFKKYGHLCLKKKENLNARKKKFEKVIAQKTLYGAKKKTKKNSCGNLKKDVKEKANLFSSNIKLFLKILKKIKIEQMYIYEKFGFLNPLMTSLIFPIISFLTIAPLNFFSVNHQNFKYEILPQYNDLKLNLVVKAKISFRIIEIIACIIECKFAQIIYKMRR